MGNSVASRHPTTPTDVVTGCTRTSAWHEASCWPRFSHRPSEAASLAFHCISSANSCSLVALAQDCTCTFQARAPPMLVSDRTAQARYRRHGHRAVTTTSRTASSRAWPAMISSRMRATVRLNTPTCRAIFRAGGGAVSASMHKVRERTGVQTEGRNTYHITDTVTRSTYGTTLDILDTCGVAVENTARHSTTQ